MPILPNSVLLTDAFSLLRCARRGKTRTLGVTGPT